MPTTRVDENGNAGPVGHEEEGNDRRRLLKQIGLTAGALAVTAVGSSAASAARGSSDAEHRIMERALKDEEYRKRLIADPTKVIGKEVGTALPPGVQFKVLQETADTVYLVLPYLPAVGAGRVSKSDLQGGGAVGLAFTRSWFRRCPCRCSSLSVCD